jgi:hypothetical protein
VTGVAMLAGLGAGIYRDPSEAIARCSRSDPPVEPDPTVRTAYQDAAAAHRAVALSAAVRGG